MFDQIKEQLHIIVIVNILISTFILMTKNESNIVNFVNVEGSKSSKSHQKLRIAVCELAFTSLQEEKISNFYFHPDIIKGIHKDHDDSFNVEEVDNFYFKMEGRETCRIVGKSKQGFIAFEAIVSSNGPLFYRITSLKSIKPTYSEIKEYL